ncbi:DUF441 domain-containing protein [Natranaerofaba carboxydovora]|uniref:DUF441 domain-containing protein n=1 Tax=Natranaerofaba carboxydovora TaxID=2742683 RepID=UPI001F137CC7|nr:DUF441 domain-containing protein [Natranaerofaba carboxydovora]UMZ72821.1 hypothetical protein ACONDI_00351 [Natranaerofaba carboxydovora]
MSQGTIVILVVLLLSLIGRNNLVIAAAALLLVMRLTVLKDTFPFLIDRGIELGILFLTLSVLTPFAAGQVTLSDVLNTVKSPAGLAAILSGVLASYFTGEGVNLLKTRPEIMVGLIIGSILGASLLKGVPAGPLVAAGFAAVIIQKLNL